LRFDSLAIWCLSDCNAIALLEKLAASICRTWTGLEAGGSRFLQNVSNYIPVAQQHHIVGDLNLGPIFCWISPTYLLWHFALQDWPILLPCRFLLLVCLGAAWAPGFLLVCSLCYCPNGGDSRFLQNIDKSIP
jgi:hypothetical protein